MLFVCGVLHRADYPRKPRGCLPEVRRLRSALQLLLQSLPQADDVDVGAFPGTARLSGVGGGAGFCPACRAEPSGGAAVERWRFRCAPWNAGANGGKTSSLTPLWQAAGARFMPPVASHRLPGQLAGTFCRRRRSSDGASAALSDARSRSGRSRCERVADFPQRMGIATTAPGLVAFTPVPGAAGAAHVLGDLLDLSSRSPQTRSLGAPALLDHRPLAGRTAAAGELQGAPRPVAKSWRHPAPDRRFALAPRPGALVLRGPAAADPVAALRNRLRGNLGRFPSLSPAGHRSPDAQYREHPGWTVQLHFDNLRVALAGSDSRSRPIRRSGVTSRRRACFARLGPNATTEGALLARDRLERLEVRSFEVDHVSALWHLDFHHAHARCSPAPATGSSRCCLASSTIARGWSAICSGISTRPPRASCMACRRRS
jgi:hypothetical protein